MYQRRLQDMPRVAHMRRPACIEQPRAIIHMQHILRYGLQTGSGPSVLQLDVPAAASQLRVSDLPCEREDARLIVGLGDEQDQHEDDDLRSI